MPRVENAPEDSQGTRRYSLNLPEVVATEVDEAVGILDRDSSSNPTVFLRDAAGLFARLVKAIDRGAEVDITILEPGKERPTHILQPVLLEFQQHRERRRVQKTGN